MSTPLGTWRYRLNLTSTVKDGYRVGDATLEFTELTPSAGTWEGNYDSMSKEYRTRLEQLIEDGQAVAADLNHDREDASKYSK